jgi:formate hydrogenlyase subunit 6/NADH:ubiquinone oxidoreductase subunit I
MIQIDWSDERCITPRECLKCFEACPEGIFMMYPRDRREAGKVAGDWAIKPSFFYLCTGCGICEEVCPKNALKVSVAK